MGPEGAVDPVWPIRNARAGGLGPRRGLPLAPESELTIGGSGIQRLEGTAGGAEELAAGAVLDPGPRFRAGGIEVMLPAGMEELDAADPIAHGGPHGLGDRRERE